MEGDGTLGGDPRVLSAGLLDAFLLSCIRSGVVRGRELLAAVRDPGLEGVRSGELYRVLRSMEGEGLILSRREDSEYIFLRRSYGIAESGEACLAVLIASLKEYREEMDRFFEVYEKQSGVMRRAYE